MLPNIVLRMLPSQFPRSSPIYTYITQPGYGKVNQAVNNLGVDF